MYIIPSVQKKITTLVTMLLTVLVSGAQTTTAAATQPAAPGFNQLALLLLILIVVLAFVIWGMGMVLTALGRQILEKNKNAGKLLSMATLVGLSLFSQGVLAQTAPSATVAPPAPNYGGLTEYAYYMFITVIAMEVIVILFLAFSIRRMYTELLPQKIKPVQESTKFAAWWSRMDKRLFTKAVPVEKEADVMLDHDYDGIRELDNALPPWWKYGFYITIGVACIYLLNFHVLGIGLNPTEEYNAEMEKARIAIENYEANNKDKIDENNVPMADAAGIKAGHDLFQANCVACHLSDGGGSVGPNLTDDYWLHKGSLNDIYHSIKNGWPDKGMQSWSSHFSPKEISYIASFVKSLKGTKPATPKAPQGDLYVDETQPIAAPPMSAKPDSAAAKK